MVIPQNEDTLKIWFGCKDLINVCAHTDTHTHHEVKTRFITYILRFSGLSGESRAIFQADPKMVGEGKERRPTLLLL